MSTLRTENEDDRLADRIRRELQRSTSSNAESIAISDRRSDAVSSDDSERRRPAAQRRPNSDQSQLRRKIKVDTIIEGVTTPQIHSKSRGSPLSFNQQWPTARPVSAASAAASVVSSPGTASRSGRQDTSSEGDDKGQRNRRPNSGRAWSRTRSGSVWYERLRYSPNKSKDSVSKSSNEASSHAIVALTPPKSGSSVVGPPYHHNVRIEKSFTTLEADENPAPVQDSAPTSRRSSVGPLRLFTNPVELVKRFSVPRRKTQDPSKVTEQLQDEPRERQLADHNTLLRKNRTTEALRRVNSILRDTALFSSATSPVSVIHSAGSRVKSLSGQSTSSKGSGALWNKATRQIRSPISRGMDTASGSDQAITASYTSSQLALRMGVQPNNTPDERATYKIKRSPSVESEEFFKVDISIRGGTSYLPSEARRIHTPPLPQDGPDGRKRGFFFDYNAPRSSASEAQNVIDPKSIPARSTSRSSTFGKKTFLAAGKIVTKTKTNDWYDAKLAQLEEEDDMRLGRSAMTAIGSSCENARERSETLTSLAEIRKRQEEELFDYTIPEHLPSSPLCPRHPRYWRVVKGVGSQFRGCWMHGVGEWEAGGK